MINDASKLNYNSKKNDIQLFTLTYPCFLILGNGGGGGGGGNFISIFGGGGGGGGKGISTVVFLSSVFVCFTSFVSSFLSLELLHDAMETANAMDRMQNTFFIIIVFGELFYGVKL